MLGGQRLKVATKTQSILISGGLSSLTLKYVTLPLIKNELCIAPHTIYGSTQITENMVCAGFQEGGKDACQGSVMKVVEFSNVAFKYDRFLHPN